MEGAAAEGADPAAVTVFFGANNASLPDQPQAHQQVPLAEYQDNLRAICAYFKSKWPSAAIIVITPPLIHEPARIRYQIHGIGSTRYYLYADLHPVQVLLAAPAVAAALPTLLLPRILPVLASLFRPILLINCRLYYECARCFLSALRSRSIYVASSGSVSASSAFSSLALTLSLPSSLALMLARTVSFYVAASGSDIY